MPRAPKKSEKDLTENLPESADSFTPADRPNEAADSDVENYEPQRPPTKEELRRERYGE